MGLGGRLKKIKDDRSFTSHELEAMREFITKAQEIIIPITV